jgi:hypothetical protein
MNLIIKKETYYCSSCDSIIDKPIKRPAFCSDECKKKYRKERKVFKVEYERIMRSRK